METPPLNINIRNEKVSDIQSIHKLTAAAFIEAPHTDHTEQFIVDALRKSGSLSISLVAEDADNIVGHVAVSPVSIADGATGWYGLGPISVSPSEQGRGIGSAIMEAAILNLRELNADGCVLLGDPNYYKRFGFSSMKGLELPDVPAEYFQALMFSGDLPQGIVTYHESFLATA